MTIEYRPLHQGEESALITLWRDVLGNSDDQSLRALHDFGNDPSWPDHTLVAVQEGEIIASARYWLREMCDARGQPQRVGHVLGVATRSDARRQGHATYLLNLVTDEMLAEGCAWSVLFARPEAASVYERVGWRGFASAWQQGPVSPSRRPVTRYRMKPPDAASLANGLDDLCSVYAAFNATRPLSVVRSRAYWEGYAAWMLNDWLSHHGTRLIVAEDEATTVGYAVYNIYSPHFVISELCIRPDRADAAPALLDAIAHEAPDIVGGRVLMPSDPITDSAVRGLFGDQLQRGEDHTGLMAKPLAVTVQTLDQTFAKPAAHYWSLDGY